MKWIYATKLIQALRTIAKPSDYVSWLKDAKPQPVVLYARESDRSQTGNLEPHIKKLKQEAERRGCSVVAVCVEIVPGWVDMYSEGRRTRIKLEQAVVIAQETDASILTESISRYRRSWDPKWKQGKRQPPLTVFDMERLLEETQGVPLLTVINPDASADEGEERSYQVKRGQAGKNRYGGRPKGKESKKAKRLRKRPMVIALRNEGFSYRQIGRKLGVHWSTVRDWLNR